MQKALGDPLPHSRPSSSVCTTQHSGCMAAVEGATFNRLELQAFVFEPRTNSRVRSICYRSLHLTLEAKSMDYGATTFPLDDSPPFELAPSG
jgi:hypothetical protein